MILDSPFDLKELPEKISKFPDCPHLKKRNGDSDSLKKHNHYCLWLSEKLGASIHASPPICNLYCYKSGPYCGRKIIDQEMADEFLFTHWLTKYSFGAKRVLNNFLREAKICIPPEWEKIFEVLNFMYAEGVQRILLTGSMITDAPRPLKDYDIILVFDSITRVVDFETEIRSKLPTVINGTKTDFFLTASTTGVKPDGFYLQLDPIKNILYTSRWFEPQLVDLDPRISVDRINVSPTFVRLLTDAIHSQDNKVDRIPQVRNPGDILAWAIHQLTGFVPCASCVKHATQMNEWGWIGCWSHRGEIMEWIKEEANKRGVTVEKAKLLDLLRAAWKISGKTQELDRKDLTP